jgi:hypothetical protein
MLTVMAWSNVKAIWTFDGPCRSIIGHVSFDQDMFAGGSEIVVTTLQWTMAEVTRNPTVMQKVQVEINNLVFLKQ